MIKKATTKDAGLLAGLAIQMWKDHTLVDLADGFKQIIEKDDMLKERRLLPWDIWKQI